MIVFDLACSREHVFEGWFASAEEFDSQQARGLVRCPVCNDATIVKRPSAVSVHVPADGSAAGRRERSGGTAAGEPRAETQEGAGSGERRAVTTAVPAEIVALQRELLARVRKYVRETEDVGDRFAEEARRIHYEEAPRRNIRGRASDDDAESLRDEGIEFHALPRYLVDDVH
jgi:hypothetical protein